MNRLWFLAIVVLGLTVGCGPESLAGESAVTREPTAIPETQEPTPEIEATAEVELVTPTHEITLPPTEAVISTSLPNGGSPAVASWMQALPLGAVQRIGIGGVNTLNLSPDGTLIAAGTSAGIAMLDAETLEVRWFAAAPLDVTGIAWSPDNSRLAIWLNWANSLAIFEAASGQLIRSVEFEGQVNTAQWSPDSLSLSVATEQCCSETSSPSMFLLNTGGEITKILSLTDTEVYGFASLDWSPDGTLLAASGGSTDVVVVWQVDTAEIVVFDQLESYNYGFNVLEFNPAGTMLAAVSATDGGCSPSGDPRVFTWDVETGERQMHLASEELEYDVAYDLLWSPDGSTLVSVGGEWGSGVGEVVFWDVVSWTPRHIARTDVTNYGIIPSPDGTAFMTRGSSWETGSKTIRWNIYTGGYQEVFAGEDIYTAFWMPDGQRIGGVSGGVGVWDIKTGQKLLSLTTRMAHETQDWAGNALISRPLPSPEGDEWYSEYAWSPDGSLLATRTGSEIILFDAVTLVEQRRWAASLYGWSDRLLWSPDGSMLASVYGGGEEAGITIWNPADGTQLHHISTATDARDSMGFPTAHLSAIDWSPNGSQLVIAVSEEDWDYPYNDAAGTLSIYDLATGHQRLVLEGLNGRIDNVDWSPDGSRIAATSSNGYDAESDMVVWDASTGGQLLKAEAVPTTWVQALQWSPDSTMLALAGGQDNDYEADLSGEDYHVFVWHMTIGQQIYAFAGHNNTVTRLLWSDDGSQLASTSRDGTVFVWRVP